MKKFFLFSVAALAFCACSSDEIVSENNVANQQPKEISFAPLTMPNTRAAVDGTGFPTDLSMMVTAYDAEKRGVFFDATTFSKGSSTTWAGTPSKYWPLAPATINFLAIANANADNETGVTWGSNKADQVTIVMSDNSTAQRDLMYACGTGSVTQTSNALEFPTNVPMIFKHAQAWIKFTVKANSATEVSKLTVNSITLNSVSCAGTYVVTHANYDKTAAQRTAATPAGYLDGSVSGVWSSYSASAGNKAVIQAGGYSALSTSEQAFGDLMVVPDQGMASFTINYTVDNNTYNYTYTPASTSLAQATKYVYNISFGLHEILIAPTVAEWTAYDFDSTTAGQQNEDITIE